MSERLQHHVLWHCALIASAEHASILTVGHDRTAVESRTALPLGDVPCDIEYRLGVDTTTDTAHLEATIHANGHRRDVVVDAKAGVWTIDGSVDDDLEGCTDIDLGWSPVTNGIVIRALGLEVGASMELLVAWFRFPELRIEAVEQTYTREAEDRWRFQSGPFDHVIEADPTTGIVTKYGDDLWEAAARTTT